MPRNLEICFFKDKLPKKILSGLVYKCTCSDNNDAYYGNRKRQFKVRICKHLVISHLSGKKLDNNNLTSLTFQLIFIFSKFSFLTEKTK